MANRYYVNPPQGDTIQIDGPDAQHLAKVLRVRPGEVLTLCDGQNTDYRCEVVSVSVEEVLARVVERYPSLGEPDIRTQMYIGYAKGERMDFAVQKAVELGASEIVPFFSQNSVVKPKNVEGKQARLSRIAREAAKQCGRGILPEVGPPLDFARMLERAAESEKAFFFYENGGMPLREAVGDEKQFALITGPEGGFAPEEAEMALEAGCLQMGLGPRILRCETAPCVALAALMTLTGNLG